MAAQLTRIMGSSLTMCRVVRGFLPIYTLLAVQKSLLCSASMLRGVMLSTPVFPEQVPADSEASGSRCPSRLGEFPWRGKDSSCTCKPLQMNPLLKCSDANLLRNCCQCRKLFLFLLKQKILLQSKKNNPCNHIVQTGSLEMR